MTATQTLRARLGLDGADVVILGLGVTGRALATVLAEAGAAVLASEAGPLDEEERRKLERDGIEVEVGSHDRAAARLDDADVVVPSPGISPLGGILHEALERGVAVASELDLAQRLTDAVVVGVTGTKGKTTVCRLVERVARAHGLDAHACGNTEIPFITAAAEHPTADLFVVEASSFRLCFATEFHPRAAVVTTRAPDHYDWHGTMEHYRAAKARVAQRQDARDLFLHPAGQPELADMAPSPGPRVVAFGDERRPGAWVEDDDVVVALDGDVRAPGASALAGRGAHFAADAAAACAAAVFLGVGAAAIETGLRSFVPDPHRLDLVGERGGVRYYDDSIATNPLAAVASIASFESVVLICGGRNKGLDLTPLRSETGRLRAVVAMGESADEIGDVFAPTGVTVEVAASMDDAVRRAAARAVDGDAVLLAPACAAFDAYSGYAERGDDFVRACRSLGVEL